MIFGMTYYQIFWYFLIYSFFGWVIEVIYHAVTLGKIINRGFLNGPVCPVYGFGVISVFAMINLLEGNGQQMNDIWIFIFGVTLATLIELIAGWLLDICFHARWWDYSNKPLNFRGYICAEFSIIWGLAILLVVRVFQSYVEKVRLQNVESKQGLILLEVLYLVYIADVIVTVSIIQGFNKKLKQLDQIRTDMRIVSDKLSDKLGGTTIETAQKIEKGKVQAALAKAELRDAISEKKKKISGMNKKIREESIEELQLKSMELHNKFDELSNSFTEHRLFGRGHLISAFPNMKHRRNAEMVKILREKMKSKT